MPGESYSALASCYDALMTADYAEMAERLSLLIGANGTEGGALVLELGCGTGSLTLEMAKRGWDMLALDLSPDMLCVAREKLCAAGQSGVVLLQQDMRSFELYGSVAAIVCALDGVNYLCGRGDLARCFRTAHNYLDPGGLLLFDVNTPYKFAEVFAGRDYVLSAPDAFCGWHNSYDPKTKLCEFALTVFTREGGLWRRGEETQYERCYGERAITRALTDAGFADIRFFSGYTDAPATEIDERWLVSARKA